MSHTDEMIRKLGSEDVKEQLRYLYGSDEEMLAYQLKRYTALIRRYAELFGEEDRIQLISVPGRTEIGGNHTDHKRPFTRRGNGTYGRNRQRDCQTFSG